jgi:hypothetical protein
LTMPERLSSPRSKRSTVRFAVGRPDGPRSSVWRLWTRGDDIYLSLRDLTKAQKISLHSSGRWRNAWTTEQVAKGLPFVGPGQDRATDKWDRPPELAPGVTRAFDVVVPASEVTEPEHYGAKLPAGKEIVWVPAAPQGFATYCTVVLTAAETTVSGWPGRNGMGSRLLWKQGLPNGETVWLIAFELPVNEWLEGLVAGFKRSVFPEGRRMMEEAGYSGVEEARAAIYVRREEPRMRAYIDLSGQPHFED